MDKDKEIKSLEKLATLFGTTPEELYEKTNKQTNPQKASGMLTEILSCLSPRERDVLRLRFGFDDGRNRTLQEVGELFDDTADNIRYIEARAIQRLKNFIENKKADVFNCVKDVFSEQEQDLLNIYFQFEDRPIKTLEDFTQKYNLNNNQVLDILNEIHSSHKDEMQMIQRAAGKCINDRYGIKENDIIDINMDISFPDTDEDDAECRVDITYKKDDKIFSTFDFYLKEYDLYSDIAEYIELNLLEDTCIDDYEIIDVNTDSDEEQSARIKVKSVKIELCDYYYIE